MIERALFILLSCSLRHIEIPLCDDKTRLDNDDDDALRRDGMVMVMVMVVEVIVRGGNNGDDF